MPGKKLDQSGEPLDFKPSVSSVSSCKKKSAPRRIVWESFEQWLSSDILRDRLQRGPLPLGTPLSEGFDALCAERYQGEPRCNRCPRISSGNFLGSFSTRFSEEPKNLTEGNGSDGDLYRLFCWAFHLPHKPTTQLPRKRR